MKGAKPALEDTRCSICCRFIPRGYTARLSNGSVQCLTHPIGVVSIDKAGGAGALLSPSEQPEQRGWRPHRQEVMTEVAARRAGRMEIL